MPRCAKCRKATIYIFSYKVWNSEILHREFNGKFLCKKCYGELSKKELELKIQLEERQKGLRICRYCQTSRNINQYPQCPKCGAS